MRRIFLKRWIHIGQPQNHIIFILAIAHLINFEMRIHPTRE